MTPTSSSHNPSSS